MSIAKFPKLGITVEKTSTGRLQIIKHFPECIPSSRALGPSDLNNKYVKLVHSEIVKSLRPFFVEGTGNYGFDAGFDKLPENLIASLLEHLKDSDSK